MLWSSGAGKCITYIYASCKVHAATASDAHSRAECIHTVMPGRHLCQAGHPSTCPLATWALGCMRGLLGTDCTQPLPCACIRPEGMGCCLDYNMYTTSACVMHCQLPCTKASQGAVCSPSPLPPERVNRLHHTMHRCPGAGSASHTLLHVA